MSNQRPADLTGKAVLTLLAGLAIHFIGVGSNFVVAPLIVSGLGPAAFGTWGLINQITNYLTVADLNPAGALKLIVGREQASTDHCNKLKAVGASVLVWATTLPVVIVLILLASLLVSRVADPGISRQAFAATAVIGISVCLNRVTSIPGAFMRAMNVEYKGVAFVVLSELLKAALMVLSLTFFGGLVALSTAVLLGSSVSNFSRFWVCRKVFPWFGAKMPDRKELGSHAAISVWMILVQIGEFLLLASDLILISLWLGAQACGVYAATRALVTLLGSLLAKLSNAAAPGFVGVCARREPKLILQLRGELQSYTLAFGVPLLGVAVVYNLSFVTLWIGDEMYAGNFVTGCLVVGALLRQTTQIDCLIMMNTLRLRTSAAVTYVCSLVGIVLAALLMPHYGLGGAAVGYTSAIILRAVTLSILVAGSAARCSHILVGLALLIGMEWFVHVTSSWAVIAFGAAVYSVVILLLYLLVSGEVWLLRRTVARLQGLRGGNR
ncbi:MAG TPA: hypothetical protein DDW52_26750 [Planctomycetaceae bacterium]|nr:hypothetical protein [Planctomycetaceae bacterium]